ncbi:pyruvate kinase [Alkalispirochaeta americana]|uniref:Pyruvate kinase n=1 Tax=Alkalispirochaeta americana TaxID=159291 RepID=A0A1N6UJ27_9SPIO|nr:pyruvate kinase [Alkalispirochaeta americana]SIQ65620.1 pyruvate kinase [Alkalispirochaeta americana]
MEKKLTKIVATVSDRRCEVDFIKGLYTAGMNVVRLNTAHQDPEGSLQVIKNTRAVSDEIALMVDTKGPEVRTRLTGSPFSVSAGDTVVVTDAPLKEKELGTTYEGFVDDLSPGKSILIDDGSLELQVLTKEPGRLVCRVCNDGEIENKKSINVPDAHLNVPALSEKDMAFIDFAIEQDLDFIAHSFVRSAGDVIAIQKILDDAGSAVKIVAKIENREGIRNLEEIIPHVAGVMIARGDLGIEIPAEQVPAYQKHIIELCRKHKRPVITATQMLHSMIKNPRPTRAEVSDVANAVYDGTDAIMLSGETAQGSYPLEAVQTMTRISRETERARSHFSRTQWIDPDTNQRNFLAKTVDSACRELPIKAVLSDTETGRSARVLSSYRMEVPIFARSPSKRVVRELSLSFGVFPAYMEYQASTDQLVANSLAGLLQDGVIDELDLVVIMGGAPGQSEGTNFVEINKASACLHLYSAGTPK